MGMRKNTRHQATATWLRLDDGNRVRVGSITMISADTSGVYVHVGAERLLWEKDPRKSMSCSSYPHMPWETRRRLEKGALAAHQQRAGQLAELTGMDVAIPAPPPAEAVPAAPARQPAEDRPARPAFERMRA